MDGKVITIYQLSFFTPDYSPLPSGSVPLVGGGIDSYVSLGTGLLKASSLMGCFLLQPQKVSQSVNMISPFPHEQTDSWILSTPSDIDTHGEQMSLSPAELAYKAFQIASESLVTLVSANGTTAPPITAPSFDPLNQVLSVDEAIREITRLEERPWEDSHHHVSTYDSDMMTLQILSPDTHEIISSPYTTIQILESEGNRGNISQTLLPDISVMAGIMDRI